MSGYIIRISVHGKATFGLRMMDRTTKGIGCHYFTCIGEAREYAEKIGLNIMTVKGLKDSRTCI